MELTDLTRDPLFKIGYELSIYDLLSLCIRQNNVSKIVR